MKYIIVGYTANIDTKLNITKINYVADQLYWTDDIKDALYFDTRKQADEFIENCNLRYAVSYGVNKKFAKNGDYSMKTNNEIYKGRRYVLLAKTKDGLKSDTREPLPFTRREIAESWKEHYEEKYGLEFVVKEVEVTMNIIED